MNERAITFGPNSALVGVLTLPEHPQEGAPGVLLLNAGLLHRVGPNRLHVELARRLAAMGYPTLRFDMSGVGDSELQGGGDLYIERSKQDVVEAMDALNGSVGADRFVLMGLCTGAFNAFRVAVDDERVAGCVLIDGYSYPTRKSQLRHYRRRVLQLDRWIAYMGRRLGLADASGGERPEDLVVFENEVVPRERFAQELTTLVERDTELFMIYTEFGPLAYTYEAQMKEAFPEIDLSASTVVRYYQGTDHTFTLPGNRERLMRDIETWMHQRHHLPAGAAR